MTDPTSRCAPKLDAREQHFRIPGPRRELSLFLRYLGPENPAPADRRVVLYVHGATFASSLSIAHRFDGNSWRDDLCAAGFHVWGLDFHGFGGLSDDYPEMSSAAERHAPLGRVADAGLQLEQAVRFICERQGVERLSIVAHSWGTLVAGHFAARCPQWVDRLVLFGPITWRPRGPAAPQRLPAWRLITLQQQWDRFVADVPAGEAPVLSRRHFDAWGEAYLDGDPASRTRSPASVQTPCGPPQDIEMAWAGDFAYDPGSIRAPVAIIRGEWDSLCTDADARWLFDALKASPVRRDIKIGRATHLMHLEKGRFALYRETETFLNAESKEPPCSP